MTPGDESNRAASNANSLLNNPAPGKLSDVRRSEHEANRVGQISFHLGQRSALRECAGHVFGPTDPPAIPLQVRRTKALAHEAILPTPSLTGHRWLWECQHGSPCDVAPQEARGLPCRAHAHRACAAVL